MRQNLNLSGAARATALEQELARKLATMERELGVLSGRLVQLSEAMAESEAKLKQQPRLVDVSLQP